MVREDMSAFSCWADEVSCRVRTGDARPADAGFTPRSFGLVARVAGGWFPRSCHLNCWFHVPQTERQD